MAVSETTTGCKRPLSALAFITAQAFKKTALTFIKAAQALLKAAQAVPTRSSCFIRSSCFTRSGCFNSLKLFLKFLNPSPESPSPRIEETCAARRLSRSYSDSTQTICPLKWTALLMVASHCSARRAATTLRPSSTIDQGFGKPVTKTTSPKVTECARYRICKCARSCHHSFGAGRSPVICSCSV